MAKHPLTVAREEKKISQSKLGHAVGINANHISEIESWKRYPCPSWRDKLSRFFGLPEHELFPTPADLIDTIRDLTQENLRLSKLLEDAQKNRGVPLQASRDNTRFL